MEPIKFPEANKILAKPESMSDSECGSLPIYCDGQTCTSCWKMTWKERLSALLFGKVWVYVVSGQTQPPIALEATRTVFVKVNNNKEKHHE